MKKPFYFGLAFAALAAGGCFLMGNSTTSHQFTPQEIANIEALTATESAGPQRYLYVVPVEYKNGWGCNCAGKGPEKCCDEK